MYVVPRSIPRKLVQLLSGLSKAFVVLFSMDTPVLCLSMSLDLYTCIIIHPKMAHDYEPRQCPEISYFASHWLPIWQGMVNVLSTRSYATWYRGSTFGSLVALPKTL